MINEGFNFNKFNISVRIEKDVGYIRVFTKGIHWKNKIRSRLYFSKRNNLTPSITIGNWRITLLK